MRAKNKRSWIKRFKAKRVKPKKKVATVTLGIIPEEFYFEINGKAYESGEKVDIFETEGRLNIFLKAKYPEFEKAIVPTVNKGDNTVSFVINKLIYDAIKLYNATNPSKK